jgi:hypothetical protein
MPTAEEPDVTRRRRDNPQPVHDFLRGCFV